MRKIKTAKDMNRNIIKIGDTIEAYDFYTKRFTGVVVTILDMWHQGYDGVILKCDKPPVPKSSKYHFTHPAKYSRKELI